MGRPVEHRVDRAPLDDAPGVHDADLVGQRGHDRQVVGDPDHRRAGQAAQLLRLVQNLPLDGDVERRGRLVGDDQVGLVQEGDGDGDALAHAAGKLVRIGLEALVGTGDADQGEGLPRPRPRGRVVDALVRADRLDHLRVDPQHRIEGHHRILEDHGDARPAQLAHLAVGQTDEVAALESDPAADDPSRRIDQTHDRESGDRLAGPRFADQAQNAALRDFERHAVDRLDDARPGLEPGRQILDDQRRRARHPRYLLSRGLSTSRS
jgi:hypothetical protein